MPMPNWFESLVHFNSNNAHNWARPLEENKNVVGIVTDNL